MSGTETAVAGPRVAVLETEEARNLLEAGKESGSLSADDITLSPDGNFGFVATISEVIKGGVFAEPPVSRFLRKAGQQIRRPVAGRRIGIAVIYIDAGAAEGFQGGGEAERCIAPRQAAYKEFMGTAGK